MRLFKAASSIFLTLCGQPALSESERSTFIDIAETPGLVRYVELVTDDQVSDECWMNSRSVISKLRLMFEQNDIPVIDYEPAFYGPTTVRVNIGGLGFRDSAGRCIVAATFEVESIARQSLGGYQDKPGYTLAYISNIFDDASVFSNPQAVDEQFAKFVDSAASDFIADIISARRTEGVRKYFVDSPPSGELPMSDEAWKALLEKRN